MIVLKTLKNTFLISFNMQPPQIFLFVPKIPFIIWNTNYKPESHQAPHVALGCCVSYSLLFWNTPPPCFPCDIDSKKQASYLGQCPHLLDWTDCQTWWYLTSITCIFCKLRVRLGSVIGFRFGARVCLRMMACTWSCIPSGDMSGRLPHRLKHGLITWLRGGDLQVSPFPVCN